MLWGRDKFLLDMRCEQIAANKYSLRSHNVHVNKVAKNFNDENEDDNFASAWRSFLFSSFITRLSMRNKNPITGSIGWKIKRSLIEFRRFFLLSTAYWWSKKRIPPQPLIFFSFARSPPFDIVLTKSLSIHLTLNDSSAHSAESMRERDEKTINVPAESTIASIINFEQSKRIPAHLSSLLINK